MERRALSGEARIRVRRKGAGNKNLRVTVAERGAGGLAVGIA